MSSAEERLRESLKSPYPTDGEGWEGLIKMAASEIDVYDETLQEVEDNQFVDTASEGALEKVGSVFGVERYTDESTEAFRSRIKSRLRAQLSSGTNEDIVEAASVLLNADIDTISIVEPDGAPRIRVITPVDSFSQIQTTGQVWDEVLSTVTAVGVSLETAIDTGDFRFSISALTFNETISETGDLHGSDSLDGEGSFGAGYVDDPTGQTAVTTSVSLGMDNAQHQTLSKQLGASKVGVGELDGEADEAGDAGFTSADAFAVVVSTADATTVTIKVGGFAGNDAFTGSGAFGAGGDTDVSTGTTSVGTTLKVVWNSTVSNSVDGFGSGSFDGSNQFD